MCIKFSLKMPIYMVDVADILNVLLEVVALPKEVFSTKEAAEYCNVSSETIRRWIRTKGLKAYNTGQRIRIKIKKDHLDEFVTKNNILTKE